MKASKTILIANGPNLDRLGQRENAIYGTLSLDRLADLTNARFESFPVDLLWFQSAFEGEIIQRIHQAADQAIDGLVINPGGLAHTSVALHDAMKSFPGPVAEVHLSNTQAREEFRRTKITARAATIIIEGTGEKTYILGVLALLGGQWSIKQQN